MERWPARINQAIFDCKTGGDTGPAAIIYQLSFSRFIHGFVPADLVRSDTTTCGSCILEEVR